MTVLPCRVVTVLFGVDSIDLDPILNQAEFVMMEGYDDLEYESTLIQE